LIYQVSRRTSSVRYPIDLPRRILGCGGLPSSRYSPRLLLLHCIVLLRISLSSSSPLWVALLFLECSTFQTLLNLFPVCGHLCQVTSASVSRRNAVQFTFSCTVVDPPVITHFASVTSSTTQLSQYIPLLQLRCLLQLRYISSRGYRLLLWRSRNVGSIFIWWWRLEITSCSSEWSFD